MIGLCLKAGELAPTAQLYGLAFVCEFMHPVDQEFLEIVLLQVDEGRPPLRRLGRQVELVDLALVEEHPARDST